MLAEAPGGVGRLRELVLQLAVRGKLVARDPADEPASVFLGERAADVDDGPFALPEGWAWSTLAKLGDVRGGGTPSKANATFWNGSIPWVTPKDMKRDCIGGSQDSISENAIAETSVKRIRAGSLLMVVRGMILAHSFPTALTTAEVTVNQDMKALLPFNERLAPFLLLATRGLKYQVLDLVKRSTHGTCKLPTDRLFSMPVPLPPLAEQERIVATVAELIGLLDRLEVARKTREVTRAALRDSALAALRDADAPDEVEVAWKRIAERLDDLIADSADLEPLRQTVIQLAVRGRLVRQEPADESVGVLLNRVAEEKALLTEAGNVRKRRQPHPIENGAGAFDIPVGWQWCKMGDVLLDIEAGWSPSALKRAKKDDEWGVLKVSSCSWGEFLPSENKALAPGTQPRVECEVRIGDLLISRANTTELVGRSVVVKTCPSKLMLSDKTLRLRVGTDVVAEFINLVNLAETARAHYESSASGTSASMKNVSQDVIWSTPVPLAPVDEQRRIVAKVEELMDLIDRLEQRLSAQETTQDAFAAAAVHQLDAARPGCAAGVDH